MEDTINELTNEFQSFQNIPLKNNSISSPKRFLSTASFIKENYKKILVLIGILFVLSLLLVIFFLDSKFYKKEEKVRIECILLYSIFTLLFLLFFFLLTKWIVKKFFKNDI